MFAELINATPARQRLSRLIGLLLLFFFPACFCGVTLFNVLSEPAAPPPRPTLTNTLRPPVASATSAPTSQPTRTAVQPRPAAAAILAPQPTATGSRVSVSDSYCIPNTSPVIGTVSEVIDGETIKVLVAEQTYTVTYIGIAAPDILLSREYFGPEAAARNAELVLGKQVALYKDVSEADRYQRWPRYVVVENQFVNLVLVQQGFASAHPQAPDLVCAGLFKSAEQQASAALLGMWQPTPTNPPGDLTLTPVLATPQVITLAAYDHNGDGKITCSDFQTQAEAQSLYNAGYTKLDGSDKDGKVCESLP